MSLRLPHPKYDRSMVARIFNAFLKAYYDRGLPDLDLEFFSKYFLWELERAGLMIVKIPDTKGCPDA